MHFLPTEQFICDGYRKEHASIYIYIYIYMYIHIFIQIYHSIHVNIISTDPWGVIGV